MKLCEGEVCVFVCAVREREWERRKSDNYKLNL